MDLTELSIDDLVNIEVTSVSKRLERLYESASAVYVITQEDIRRSGVTSIAEALRMAPGLHVAHVDINKWAISSRGFNDRWADKLLVMIDGRSVYSPTFSGVWWDVQDYLLEDIDRIEVIRGPGATLWGANAVNGIINIITSNAADSQGLLVGSMMGAEERTPGQFRYGARIGSNGYFRMYAKNIDRDNSVYASGAAATDAWGQSRAGFRTDFELRGNSRLTVQGDTYSGNGSQSSTLPSFTAPYYQTLVGDINVTGQNLLARWNTTTSKNTETTIQLYYDKTDREQVTYDEKRSTIDLELQRRFSKALNHDVTWGLGFRRTGDDTSSGPMQASIVPASQTDSLVNAFVQDDITLRDDVLRLAVGAKLERNDYTGMEIQPGLRLLWTPDKSRTGWAAISRAVRSPSRADYGARIPLEVRDQSPYPPLLLVVTGNPNFKSEVLWAYEMGYRVMPSYRLSLDAAAFYNDYSRLRTYSPTGAPYLETDPVPHLVMPVEMGNLMRGRSCGLELAAQYSVSPRWRLAAGYTFLNVRLDEDPSTGASAAEVFAGYNPRHQFHLRSFLDLPRNMELDALLYFVDELPNFDIPGYTRLDVRLGWRPKSDLSVCIGVQNLLDNQHAEFGKTSTENPTEVQRTFYGQLTWRR